MLDARERRLFRWLSVAAGGSALAAVEALGGAAGIPASEVLDAASALVDHSLVRRDEGLDGEARLTMPETVRAYALRELARGGEDGTAWQAHAAHHIALAAAAEPGLKGREQGAWLARLRAEDANARAILAWALGDGDPGMGLRLAASLWRSWWMQGHVYEGLRTLEALIDRTAADAAGAEGVTDLVRAKAIHGAGVLAYWCGDFPRAVARSEQALALFRQLGEEGWSASALLPLADVARHRRDDARARDLLAESLALARRAGDAQGVAFALMLLGVLWSEQGHDDRAVTLYEESVAAARGAGDSWALALICRNYGVTMERQGDDVHAESLQAESLARYRALGDRYGCASALIFLGDVAQRGQRHAHAEGLYRESLALWGEIGYRDAASVTLRRLALVASDIGRPRWAARLLGAANASREAEGFWTGQPAEVAAVARLQDALRAALGPAAFDAEWDAGTAMPPEDVTTAR